MTRSSAPVFGNVSIQQRREESRRRIRVLHVIKGLGRGGAEMLLVETLRCANLERFEYGYAYFLRHKAALVGQLEEAGRPVQCFPAESGASILLRAASLAHWVRSWDADIIHCHLPLAGITGRFAGWMTGVPIVYTEHNNLERYHPITRIMHIATWGLQDRVVAVSAAVEESIRKYSRLSVPVTTLQNGVDTKRFNRNCVRDSKQLREELGIADGQPVVGTVAVFRKQKRLEDWVEAAASIHRTFPQVVFVLVGAGPLELQIRDQVRHRGLDDAFRFVGIQQDVRPWLQLMDVFMMSSMFEGLPLALLEAMSMQCAVVATAVGGVSEVVTHGQNGLLVETGRPYDLATSVIQLLETPELRARIGRAGRAVVETKFGIWRMTEALEAIYLEVLGRTHL